MTQRFAFAEAALSLTAQRASHSQAKGVLSMT
jgi:hypothetical protein